MSVPVRLVGFAAVLVAVLLAGLGIGRAVGPVGGDASTGHATAPTPSAEQGGHDDGGNDAGDGGESGHGGGHGREASSGTELTGLAVSDGRYTLRPAQTALRVGSQDFRFTIVDVEGEPVRSFDVTHERQLHLIVVGRDGAGFQHLHPELGNDGAWSTPLTLPTAGAYRVFADFAPAGEPARALAVDVLVAGAFEPQPWPSPSDQVQADGYDVRLTGHLDAGRESALEFAVTRDGRAVDLEPYLGAAGHLVVLREGDLGYLHVHPEDDGLAFAATAPTAGRYRLYLQFQVDGVVHTASLTADAGESHP